ncbi:MAG: transposase [Chlamydiales bacterium]|nr:transposase [Chlamydiales bacterium]
MIQVLKEAYHSCLAGRPAIYSEEAILLMLILRELYKRSLRNLEGFVKSLFHVMGVNLPDRAICRFVNPLCINIWINPNS